MRILLFITSIYNTFEDIDKKKFESIIKKLEDIAEIEQDQVIIISFCDKTENRNLIFNYYSLVSNYIDFKKIYFGKQMLGNLYYNSMPSGGALLYDEPFNKERQIYKYVKSLEEEENYINLYYVNSCMIENIINELFENEKNININLISDAKNTSEIICALDKIIKDKNLLKYKKED